MNRRKLYAYFFSSLLLLPILMADSIMITLDCDDTDFSMVFSLQEEEDSEEEVELDADEDLITEEFLESITCISLIQENRSNDLTHQLKPAPVLKVSVPPPEHIFNV